MKKKIMALLLVICLALTTVMPAFAASDSFTLGSTKGTISLVKDSEKATGKTAFGVGTSITAYRSVEVTLTYKKGTATYTYTDKDIASTSVGNYTDTEALIKVYRPSSNYTVSGASSYHTVTSGSASYSNRLSV